MKILSLVSLGCLLPAVSSLAEPQVSFERIVNSATEPGNWLTYSGNYSGARHSLLNQITPANVAKLKPAWVYQPREGGKWEVTPLVVDGVIYISERPNIVSALDARTGRPLWNYRRPMATDLSACCGVVNRGLAILGDALYLATFDCHLVCLDANTGHERWDVVVADYKTGHSMTMAPLAVKDKVVVGISGGEFGIRGFLDAYDAKTGKQAWRFWTIPGPGEPGHETWGKGDAWKTGGAPTWVTGSYDPKLNLLYWGVGNPGPDYDGDNRPGDNLYSDCVIALDADTGKLRWHFQFTPHDLHDWDSNQVPIVLDAEFKGRTRQLLVTANRNGFYYVLDRTTGEFLAGVPMIPQTWTNGLDAKGRPDPRPDAVPTPEGVTVYPGSGGAVNWPGPSYSPQTGLFYVQAKENYGEVYYKFEKERVAGALFLGGDTNSVLAEEPTGVLKAIEATTGKIRWEYHQKNSTNTSCLTTAGGLVFSGTLEGQFFALDAASGALLWHFTTGSGVHGGPVTFLVDGKQHLAVASGQALFVFSL